MNMSGPIELDATNPRHRALKRLILGRKDIESALAAINYIIDNVKGLQDPMFDPLNCAAVICYARPFIGRRECPSLPNKFCQFSDSKLQRLHTDVIGLRNAFFAHRDVNENKVSIIPKGTQISWADGKGRGVVISHGDYTQSRCLTLASFPLFRALCTFQSERLREHITREKTALFP